MSNTKRATIYYWGIIICMMIWGLCAVIQFTTVREKLDSLQNQVTHLQESLKGDLCKKGQ